MTTEPKPTYEELEVQIEQLQRDLTRWRKSSDDNYNAGQGWKKQADALTQTVDKAVSDASNARAEAAELRGYIRRVNELDPKRGRQQKQDRVFDPNGIMDQFKHGRR